MSDKDVIELYREFVELMAYSGVFNDAKQLIADIESGKMRQTFEYQLRAAKIESRQISSKK